jgi:hypothetical protein
MPKKQGGVQGGNRRKSQRPPRLPSLAPMPTAPELYRIPKDRLPIVGFGIAPLDFLATDNASKSEWPIYWACQKIFKLPLDARRGPYIGYPPIWGYQVPAAGAVIDFVIYPGPQYQGRPLALRIQTEFFHNAAFGENKIALDYIQKIRLIDQGFEVYDIQELGFLKDETGKAAIMAVRNAMRGIHESDPVRGGTPVIVKGRR